VGSSGKSNNRRRGISEPVPSPYLAGMNLEELRAYRQRLRDEEDKVSYWRRLVHARMDMLEVGSHTEGSLSLEELVRVLGDTGAGHSRTALAKIRSAEPLPDLPELPDMWVTEVDPHDEDAVAQAVAKLRGAEEQVTAYRKALHQRLDEVTGELISRYRDDPATALTALPN
jgi:hypothetical protein